MNRTVKHAIGIGSIVLAGTLAVGSIASAAGRDDDGGIGRRHRIHLTDEQKCDRQQQIGERVAKVQQRIAERLAELGDRRDAAEAEGDTELVAQLDRRIERVTTLQERVDARYAGYQTWVSEHC